MLTKLSKGGVGQVHTDLPIYETVTFYNDRSIRGPVQALVIHFKHLPSTRLAMRHVLHSLFPGFISSVKNLPRQISVNFSHSDSKSRPAPLRLPTEYPSLLPLILSSSNLHISHGPWHTPGVQHHVATRTKENSLVNKELVVPFFISSPSTPRCRPIGFLGSEVMKALITDHQSLIEKKSPWEITYSKHSDFPWSVSFAPWVNEGGSDARTAHIERLVQEWRQTNSFHDMLRGAL